MSPTLADLIESLRGDAKRVAREAKHSRASKYAKGEGLTEREVTASIYSSDCSLLTTGTRAGHLYLAEEGYSG